MAIIDDYIKIIDNLSGGELLTFDDVKPLSGIGSMKFLFNDWDNIENWVESDRKYFQKLQILKKSLQKLSDEKNVRFEDIKSDMKNAILSSFYTPTPIVEEVVKSLKGLKKDRIKILEPSAGTGRFVSLLKDVFPQSEIVAIEKSYLSSSILKSAFVDHKNIKAVNNVFENIRYDNKYDVVVSNIPFANINVSDAFASNEIKKFNSTLHSYFFAKGVSLLENKGVLCYITTTGIMDSNKHRDLRKYIIDRCDLLTAIKLPNNVFKSENTAVTSDLIILQRNDKKKKISQSEKMFIDGAVMDLFDERQISSYFKNNEANIIGEIIQGNQYGDDGYSVVSRLSIEDIALKMRGILAKDIKFSYPIPQVIERKLFDAIDLDEVDSEITSLKLEYGEREGNVIRREDKFFMVRYLEDRQENTYKVDEIDLDTFFPNSLFVSDEDKIDKLGSYISLRNILKKIYNNKENNDNITDLQQELNLLYDNFTVNFGELNKLSIDDIDIALVKGLEKADEAGKIVKADIFLDKFFKQEKLYTNNFETAINNCLAKYAGINIGYLSDVMKLDESDIIKFGIDNKIFRYDPLSSSYDKIVLNNEFLSGYVTDKIDEFREIYNKEKEERPSFLTNEVILDHVEALKTVVPQRILIENIQPQFGEVFLPLAMLERFVNHYINVHDSVEILRNNQGTYKVNIKYGSEKLHKEFTITREGIGKFKPNNCIESLLVGEQQFFTYKDSLTEDIRIDTKANIAYDNLQKKFFAEWDNWVLSNADVKKQIEDIYNHGERYVNKKVDSSYLSFEETEKAFNIKMHPHQCNAVAHIIDNNGGNLDNPVGSGKTIIMINAAIKSKEAGIVKKPMISALKANVKEIYDRAKEIYPNKKILYADRKSFSPEKRKEFFAKVANNDWDLVVMSHSQMESIPLDISASISILKEDLECCEDNLILLRQGKVSKRDCYNLERKAENLKFKISELTSKADNIDLTLAKMGIDHIYLDEAHVCKNLGIETRHTRIAGLSNSSSERAKKLQINLKSIKDTFYNGEDKGFTFVSATPITNSISEMYTIQKLISGNELKRKGIFNFDSWARRYIKISTDLELTVKGTYVFKSRFREFIKVDSLQKDYLRFTFLVSKDDIKQSIAKPKVNFVIHNIEKNKMQEQYLLDVIKFTETSSYPLVMRDYDNETAGTESMLIASTQSTLASIDMRLIDPNVYDDYCVENKDTKLNKLCEEVIKIYEKENENKGTQIIFCDKGVPDGRKYNIYEAIRQQVSNVIPNEEVAFIHSYKSEEQRDKLFAEVNKGKIRLVIGSTEKLGTGVNIQQRLKAAHHIDIPWRPTDFEQRNGRIERQGNMYKDVDINYYVTNKTLDSFRFQVLKFKQYFIEQIRNINSSKINNEFESGDDISYAEMVAEITGNPVIKELAVVSKKIEVLTADVDYMLKKSYSLKYENERIKGDLNVVQKNKQKFEQGIEVWDRYKDKLEKELFYTVNNNVLSPQKFGEYVLNCEAVNSDTLIGYVGDCKNLAVFLISSGSFTPENKLRTVIYDDNKEVILNTSYNKGNIATRAETVGESAYKALTSLPLGQQNFIDREIKLEKELDKVLCDMKEINSQRISELREEISSLTEKKHNLQRLAEKEKMIVNADDKNRIKYIDLVKDGLTFTQKVNGDKSDIKQALSLSF